MKDFTSPLQILNFLDNANINAADALAQNNISEFNIIINDLRESQIYKTSLGQAVITYNNMFATSSPFFNTYQNYAFEKLKNNDFLLTDEGFRKMVNRIQVEKEFGIMKLLEAKEFTNTEEAIASSYSYNGDKDKAAVPKKNLSIDLEADKLLKSHQLYDKRKIKKLIEAQMQYLDSINELLYKSELEYTPSNESLDTEIYYVNQSIDFVKPIEELARKRSKFCLTYQQDMDIIDSSLTKDCTSFKDVYSKINTYLTQNNSIDYNKPLFYFDVISLNKKTEIKDEKYSLSQYLQATANYSKNRFAFWSQGKHYDEGYINWKRETAIRTFLYLGIPSTDLDAFFKLYGIYFGTSTEAFKMKMENGTTLYLSESYIRDLICIGLSYNVINELIPKRK